MYGFHDVSTTAYAAVVYICVGSEQPHFVVSKARVSPCNQKTSTILRLELRCSFLFARLITHVLAALELVIKVRLGSCFTDSKVVLL